MTRPKLSSRFLHDLEPFIELDAPLESVSKARVLVAHLGDCLKQGYEIDHRVLRYVLQALRRYETHSNVNLQKELGLLRPKAGNPGGQPKKRRLSPGDTEELEVRIAAFHDGKRERGDWNAFRDALAAEYRVNARTIERRRTIQKQREGTERALRSNN